MRNTNIMSLRKSALRHRVWATGPLALLFAGLSVQPMHAQGVQGVQYPSSDQTSSIALEGPVPQREGAIFKFGYSMSMGVGDLHHFIGDTSFRGYDAVALQPVYRSLFLGVSFGYNGFNQAGPRSTYQLDSGAVTAKLYRYADAWPLAFVVRYLFLDRGSVVRPYLGARTGIAWMDTSTLVVDRTNSHTSVGWLLVPEAGLDLYLSPSVLAHLSYQFNFTTASTSGFNSLSYNTIQLGLGAQL